MEPVDVRLARIEEHQVRILGEVKEIRKCIAPIAQKQERHHDWLLVLKRDNRWLFGLVFIALGLGADKVIHLIHFF